MGVHDYTCFCHSLNEGEQCLNIHEECHYDYKSETEYFDNDDHLLPSEVTDTHDESGCAANTAHLFIFEFGDLIPKTAIEAVRLIRKKQYLSVTRVEDGYSWDAWDFDSYSGYIEVLTDDKPEDYDDLYHFSVWRYIADPEESQDSSVWIVNICPNCFNLLSIKLNDEVEQEKNDAIEMMCSRYLREIALKFDIPLEGVTGKREAIRRIQAYFSFLFQ